MIPKEELYLLEIEINRSSEAELTIFLKGKNQWKSLSASSNKTFLIGGIECFYPKDQQLDGISSSFYADSVFEINNYPNLNLLLAKDIETGVTFNFGKYPDRKSVV